MPTKPSKNVQVFVNPHPDRDYLVRISCPEFTSVCPLTGQPDFATINIDYAPDKTCLELKSLKLYFWSYREAGVFFEDVTNRILNDLVSACQPKWLRVTAYFNVRGGIATTVVAEHGKRPPSVAEPPE